MKVKLYTYPDKRPDFILRQKKSMDTFLTDEFEYIVMNNGSSPELRAEIEKICYENNIKHIFIENPNHSDPTIACAYPINQSLKRYIKKDKETNISVIIDSDMFFLKPSSIIGYMGDYELAALKQIRGHVKYIWNGIVFINHKKIIDIQELDFGFGNIEGNITDVGGNMYYYFKNHPNCNLKNILHTSHIHPKNNNMEVLPPEMLLEYDADFCFEIIEKSILHYGRGSNWDGMPKDYHKNKTIFLDKFLEKSYEGNLVWPNSDYVFNLNCWENGKS
jgi:hypothetical protein